MTGSAQVLLASASPRRKDLLDQIGIRYSVQPVVIDEQPRPGEIPKQYVIRMAAEKAAQAKKQYKSKIPILAADTTVVLDGMILGKPLEEQHAVAMLKQLSGKKHQVYSAVSLWGEQHWQAINITDVIFRELTEQEILAYWRTGEPADKAGAYAIQGIGSIFVREMKGSFSGVAGLPLFETAELLSKAKINSILDC